jgi:hypothetical protein
MDSILLQRLGVTPVQPVRREPPDPRTLGPKNLRRFAVAVKARGEAWPRAHDTALKICRSRYNAGTHEMAQLSMKEGWVIQYLFPRRVPTEPRSFFSG